MASDYRPAAHPFPLASFVRASGLHVGAAAAAAALRRELVERQLLAPADFDEAFAVARITPGTNLLAMYALLGQRLAGWRGAVAALAAGTLIPAAIAGSVAAGYVAYGDHVRAAQAMQGARAGALAVLLWAVVRLLRPHVVQHRSRAVVIGVAVLLTALITPFPQILVLLAAGGAGAAVLRGDV